MSSDLKGHRTDMYAYKALSTLETVVTDFGDCHRKRRLSTIVSSVDRL